LGTKWKSFSLVRDTDANVSWRKQSSENIITDIVIDVQGFRDVEENFIPKEVSCD